MYFMRIVEKKYVSVPNHILPDLPKVTLKKELLPKPEKILNIDN